MLKLQTLFFNPVKGYDELKSVGTINFDPSKPLDKKSAAKAFHKALREYAVKAGYDPEYVYLWSPDETAKKRPSTKCWMVCWEDGPFEWAINMSAVLSGKWGYTEPYYSFDLCFVD